MKKFILLGIAVLFSLQSFAQPQNYRTATIEVESLKPGKNRILHEGMKFEVFYQNRKITKVKRLLPQGKSKTYDLKNNSSTPASDIEICWEDHVKQMSICIKCKCK